MKLPELEKPDKYVGLYAVDFGDHAGVGFTAEEVAELLESERYSYAKAYKIHRAYPDGTLELKGVPTDTFQLEAGMFFYSRDITAAKRNFRDLVALAAGMAPPCRAKVHLAACGDEKFVTALIYPAEYNDEVSRWLLEGRYKTSSEAEGGIQAVQRYYQRNPDILERQQLFARAHHASRTGEQLLASVGLAVQG